MFQGATAFNQNIGGWDTSAVKNMQHMFAQTSNFNQDISSWDTSAVGVMSQMFNGATAFNNGGQPLNWNTTAAYVMTDMFKDATTFNQDIGSWDVSALNGNSVSNMFQGATTFNQDIGSWDMTGVTFMANMFNNAIAFDQDLGSWNVESVFSFTGMFQGVTLSDANYDALLIGWDAQNLLSNLGLDVGNSQYCTMAAQTARAHMMDLISNGGDNWTIIDGGLFGGTCGLLGLEDNELDTVLLYPNPTKDVLYIQSNNILERIKVYDINGRVMQDILLSGNSSQENISLINISNGIYFINVYSNKGQITKKIIKE